MPEGNDTALTIFDQVGKEEQEAAIKNLISGKTPKEEIRWRDGPKDKETGLIVKIPYVNTYYVTRQGSLITGFRWSSECLEEKTWPPNPPYQELGAKMKVTIWDKNGNQFSHIEWGVAKIKQGISYFNQWKAAYSDGIKKCWSLFGVANDVYGNRDLQFLGEEPPESDEVKGEPPDIVMEDKPKSRPIDPDRMRFLMYLADNKIALTDAMEALGVDDLDDVTDWKEALDRMKETK